jgi:hypothetical protein
MSKYDKQFIVQVDMDSVAGKNRTALEAKADKNDHSSTTVRIRPIEPSPGCYGGVSDKLLADLRKGLGGLTSNSRLYIVGHGDWQMQCVGALSGAAMAKLLFDHGLRHAKVISVVACEAARDIGLRNLPSRPPKLLAASADSFASKFHYALNVTHDLNIDVLARTLEVAALPSGYESNVGRKVTQSASGAMLHKATGSKVRFTMRGSQQIREVVKYEDNVLYPTDERAEDMIW